MPTRIARVVKLQFSNVLATIIFLKFGKGFETTSKRLVLDNYVLAYHTADKDHAGILQTVSFSFVCILRLI